MTPNARIVPEETSVFEAATMARASGQHLLCNGRQTCISPIVPAGWSKVAVVTKPRRPIPCAA